jgi:hypothetical protein
MKSASVTIGGTGWGAAHVHQRRGRAVQPDRSVRTRHSQYNEDRAEPADIGVAESGRGTTVQHTEVTCRPGTAGPNPLPSFPQGETWRTALIRAGVVIE